MDLEVVWTVPALNDLESIVAFLAERDFDASERVRSEIVSKARDLASLPFLGAAYGEVDGFEIREVLCRKFRIFYRHIAEPARIEILRIWHHARREPRLPY